MPTSAPTRPTGSLAAFRHEAVLYDGDAAFDALAATFVADGLAAGDAIMVATSAAKLARLGDRIGVAADGVRMVDMSALGANPARIIPAWQEFASAHPGRRLRALGEPVWAGRTEPELVECRRHEELLNVAFAQVRGLWLLCPYDTATLTPDVIAGACAAHPHVTCGRGDAPAPRTDTEELCAPLPEPESVDARLPFDRQGLARVRALVAEQAERAGLGAQRRHDLVLAANEIATNSVRHGGGDGVLRVWRERTDLVCEISDHGRIVEPLAGRRLPTADQVGGRGLWMANQLCDLVQVRARRDGGVVRLWMRLG